MSGSLCLPHLSISADDACESPNSEKRFLGVLSESLLATLPAMVQ